MFKISVNIASRRARLDSARVGFTSTIQLHFRTQRNDIMRLGWDHTGQLGPLSIKYNSIHYPMNVILFTLFK